MLVQGTWAQAFLKSAKTLLPGPWSILDIFEFDLELKLVLNAVDLYKTLALDWNAHNDKSLLVARY